MTGHASIYDVHFSYLMAWHGLRVGCNSSGRSSMSSIEWPGWLKWEETAAVAFAWSGLFVACLCSRGHGGGGGEGWWLLRWWKCMINSCVWCIPMLNVWPVPFCKTWIRKIKIAVVHVVLTKKIIIIIIYSIYRALIPNGPKALYIIKITTKS